MNVANASLETSRFNMIEQQIRPWEVLDPRVLQLLHDVPRECFVPSEYRGLAFADIEIPIGHGAHMLSPKLEARMLQSVELKPTDRVLYIGTGTGYLVALMAKLAQHVDTIEIDPERKALAEKNLRGAGITNATVIQGDGARGWAANAPYDVIVFGGSSPVEPHEIRQQLKIGGRMLIVLGEAPVMRATLVQRVSEKGFRETVLFETCIAPLVNAEPAPRFSF